MAQPSNTLLNGWAPPVGVTGYAAVALGLILACFVCYQRFLHPLARFPGPVIPSLTNLWKTYYTYQATLHERVLELHLQYGPVVRVGPNDINFWNPAAISIYKAGRAMGKTKFYDAFTAFNPNLFGTRDEDVHAIRRRQLAHGFSLLSIKELEPILDEQLSILCGKLREAAKTGETFDLKDFISRYVFDILGEIAFSRSFGAQSSLDDEIDTPKAVHDHLFLACVIGNMPFQGLSKQLVAWSPIKWMRKLMKSRAHLKAVTADCVSQRIATSSGRKDLLRSLIDAKDPETGEKLTTIDINTEAFAMIVAGSHTTSGTLSLLFFHLLNNPSHMTAVVEELDQRMQPVKSGERPHQIDGLETSLPYTMACIRDNFRLNPVFTMPAWRRVHPAEGADIDGFYVPHGTNVALMNYALHHNPQTWGDDVSVFDPTRWFDDRGIGKENLLLPFSVGHRMCIGKNLAMTNILKTTSTLLTSFDFEYAMPEGTPLCFRSSGVGEMEGPLLCRVKVREGAR